MTADPDPTRRILWHDETEAAATARSRGTYPRAEPDRVDEIFGPVQRSAGRLSRVFAWAWTLLMVAGVVLLVLVGSGRW